MKPQESKLIPHTHTLVCIFLFVHPYPQPQHKRQILLLRTVSRILNWLALTFVGTAEWSRWVEYESCSVTCGKGTLEMKRHCPVYGTCAGTNRKDIRCNLEECKEGVQYTPFHKIRRKVWAHLQFVIHTTPFAFFRSLLITRHKNLNLIFWLIGRNVLPPFCHLNLKRPFG